MTAAGEHAFHAQARRDERVEFQDWATTRAKELIASPPPEDEWAALVLTVQTSFDTFATPLLAQRHAAKAPLVAEDAPPKEPKEDKHWAAVSSRHCLALQALLKAAFADGPGQEYSRKGMERLHAVVTTLGEEKKGRAAMAAALRGLFQVLLCGYGSQPPRPSLALDLVHRTASGPLCARVLLGFLAALKQAAPSPLGESGDAPSPRETSGDAPEEIKLQDVQSFPEARVPCYAAFEQLVVEPPAPVEPPELPANLLDDQKLASWRYALPADAEESDCADRGRTMALLAKRHPEVWRMPWSPRFRAFLIRAVL